MPLHRSRPFRSDSNSGCLGSIPTPIPTSADFCDSDSNSSCLSSIPCVLQPTMGPMMLAFHWPNQVLLTEASKGSMMSEHWHLTWSGVQILTGPMKNSQSGANDVGTLVFYWPNQVVNLSKV